MPELSIDIDRFVTLRQAGEQNLADPLFRQPKKRINKIRRLRRGVAHFRRKVLKANERSDALIGLFGLYFILPLKN